jgi:hypothetical protein
MSTIINDPKANPSLVLSSDNPTEIIIKWDASMLDDSDNKIRIILSIPEEHKISFLTDKGTNEKEVEWPKEYQLGTQSYDDNVFIVVETELTKPKNAKIQMHTIDSTGVENIVFFNLQYK